MTLKPLIVGVDLGTTTIKALIFERDGRIVAEAGRPTPTHYPQPTWAYHQPQALWQATVQALRQAVAQLEHPERIISIALASFGETGIPLDEHGQPTYDAIAWYDGRTHQQLAHLEAVVGIDALFRTTGLPTQMIYGLLKLLWLKENEPDAFARTRLWLNGADYIAYRLCGVAATDTSLASRTLALDLHQLRWADDILREVGVSPTLFAPLTPSGTDLGPLLPEVAQVTGLPAGTRVAVGGHDHVCGAFATGVRRPDQLLNSLGTAEAIYLPLEKPISDPAFGRQGYSQGHLAVVGGHAHYYVFGGAFTAGGSISWLRDLLSRARPDLPPLDFETLINQAEQVPPGSLGVSFLPHLRLASPPHIDNRSRGAFIGLSSDVTHQTLFRAVLEGVACELRYCLDTLIAHPDVPAERQIQAIGGGTRNRLLMQLKATIYNRPLTITNITEATALGAAALGGLAAGVYEDVAAVSATLSHQHTHVSPDARQTGWYEDYYRQVYRRLYTTLSALNHQIYALQQQV